MKSFTYERVNTPAAATAAFARTPGARFIAGGTNLLDLMKLEIETPAHLIDVSRLKLDTIEPTSDGGLRIGAMVRNTMKYQRIDLERRTAARAAWNEPVVWPLALVALLLAALVAPALIHWRRRETATAHATGTSGASANEKGAGTSTHAASGGKR